MLNTILLSIALTYVAGLVLAFILTIWWMKVYDRRGIHRKQLLVASIMASMSLFTVYLFIISYKQTKK